MALSFHLLRPTPAWISELPPHLRPTPKKVRQLEGLRESVRVGHEEFALVIAGRPASTRRTVHETYRQLKHLQPDCTERDLLAVVLTSVVSPLWSMGDNWLAGDGEIEELISRVRSLDELSDIIVARQRQDEGVDQTGWVRDRIDEILESDRGAPIQDGRLFGTRLRLSGGAGIGMAAGFFLGSSAWRGLEEVFPESRDFWGIFFWGDEWLARLLVSLPTTYLGGLTAGIAAVPRGRTAGTLSALPTSLAWLVAGMFAAMYGAKLGALSAGWWLTICVTVALSPFLGWIAGKHGELLRFHNPYFFGRRGRPLGIHWVNWLWIWIPYHFIVAEFAYSAFFILYLFIARSGLVFGIGPGLILLGALILAHAAFRGLVLLASGHSEGMTRAQVALRVSGCLIGLPMLAIALRTLGLGWMGFKESLRGVLVP